MTTIDERLEVSVTYDAERGYIASAPELRRPVVRHWRLGGLRWRIEISIQPDNVGVGQTPRRSRRAPYVSAAGAQLTRMSRALGACTHTIATDDSDLIKVRFARLC